MQQQLSMWVCFLACTPPPPLSPPFCSNTPPPTALYTLSLHDALPIFVRERVRPPEDDPPRPAVKRLKSKSYMNDFIDRKSTRLNSSHRTISYAVFCLKKKKKQ